MPEGPDTECVRIGGRSDHRSERTSRGFRSRNLACNSSRLCRRTWQRRSFRALITVSIRKPATVLQILLDVGVLEAHVDRGAGVANDDLGLADAAKRCPPRRTGFTGGPTMPRSPRSRTTPRPQSSPSNATSAGRCPPNRAPAQAAQSCGAGWVDLQSATGHSGPSRAYPRAQCGLHAHEPMRAISSGLAIST